MKDSRLRESCAECARGEDVRKLKLSSEDRENSGDVGLRRSCTRIQRLEKSVFRSLEGGKKTISLRLLSPLLVDIIQILSKQTIQQWFSVLPSSLPSLPLLQPSLQPKWYVLEINGATGQANLGGKNNFEDTMGDLPKSSRNRN